MVKTFVVGAIGLRLLLSRARRSNEINIDPNLLDSVANQIIAIANTVANTATQVRNATVATEGAWQSRFTSQFSASANGRIQRINANVNELRQIANALRSTAAEVRHLNSTRR